MLVECLSGGRAIYADCIPQHAKDKGLSSGGFLDGGDIEDASGAYPPTQ